METVSKAAIVKLQDEFFIDDESLVRYDKTFRRYDADGSGDIDTSELQKVERFS